MKAARLLMSVGVCGVVAMISGCSRPGPPALAKELTDFRTLFSENCSGCHGADGKNGAAQALNYPLYLALIPKDTLRLVIEKGRPGTSMPAFALSEGGPLSQQQVSALVEGIEENWSRPAAQGVRLPNYAYTGTADAVHGKQLFQSVCAVCHGAKGVIGPIEGPSYLTLVSGQSLRTTIIVGRPELGMPDWRRLNRGHILKDQDIADLTAYLESRRPPFAATRETRQAGLSQQSDWIVAEGGGNSPGSPPQRREEDTGSGTSSVQGGPGAGNRNTQPVKHR